MEMKKWLGPQDKESLRGDGCLSMLDMSELSTSLTIMLDVCVCMWCCLVTWTSVMIPQARCPG